uniref:Uncharacterized protein n=1 Tax=Cajanus cajan TaxID=3821 RepID=A0A151S740_CAJCA|nr:hypothetical protein KK1_027549 [Cajanus cajan]
MVFDHYLVVQLWVLDFVASEVKIKSMFVWFTRQKLYVGGMLISRCLNCGICDSAWQIAFLEARMEHLVCKNINHSPLLLRCVHAFRSYAKQLFHFHVAWGTHDHYAQVVHWAWQQRKGDVVSALRCVSQDSIVFNKEVFESIFRNKRELEAHLQGIQKALVYKG